MKKLNLGLDGLSCASCATKIEEEAKRIDGVEGVNLDFVTKKLRVELSDMGKEEHIIRQIKSIARRIEPNLEIIEENQRPIHDHEHSVASKRDLIQIFLGGLLFILPLFWDFQDSTRLTIYLIAYFLVGLEVLIGAIKNLMAGQAFDEKFLMSIATIGAFIIKEYPEGVAVMLFYQIGEYFQARAVDHSRRSISSLVDIRPEYANLEKDNNIVVVDPNDVVVGDYIIVKSGEKVPLDGLVVQGVSYVDTSNISGESVPRTVRAGDMVLSGFINGEGLLKVEVKKKFEDSTVAKILDLVENASSKKAATENFISRFARYYTPIVVFIALVIGLIPPLFLGYEYSTWAYRAFVFLVISCPCAFVISVPLGFFGGIGGASKAGVLIKGGNYLEGLNYVDTIVFDKTGTVTKGTFKLVEIEAYEGWEKEEILELAALGEAYSNHPIGISIVEAYGKEIDKTRISNYSEIPGKGIKLKIDGQDILIGNESLFKHNGIRVKAKESFGTTVHLGKNGRQLGTIVVSDELKDNISEDIKKIRLAGVKNIIMLSGDKIEIAEKVGKLVGVDKVYGDLLPQDKVDLFEKIQEETRGKVAFVGDGVNDAPVLARADIGIAMGALGSDAAIEASDIVIMTDEIGKIATGINIARNTKRIVSQNIAFALGVKLLVLVLGAFGVATMWEAVFADVGVSIIAILNSIRALKYNKS